MTRVFLGAALGALLGTVIACGFGFHDQREGVALLIIVVTALAMFGATIGGFQAVLLEIRGVVAQLDATRWRAGIDMRAPDIHGNREAAALDSGSFTSPTGIKEL
jgi:hypothetical protein